MIQPISSFGRCACPDHEIMPEYTIRNGLRVYIHGHNWKGKHHSVNSRKKMSDSHKVGRAK